MTSLASGLALEGMIPIVHTIAPFITERNYEQLKLDFGYQHQCGNFISVGNSYDYSALGSTHHCPADVNILKQIPNMEIVVAGSASEFDSLFKQSYNNGNPTYYRLSETPNVNTITVGTFGKGNIIKTGKKATIVVVGNLLDKVIDSAWDKDVTILYYTTLSPFDYELLINTLQSNKILICEPYYSGALTHEIMSNVKIPLRIETIGVPHKFLTNYGSKLDHDEAIGLTVKNIRYKLECLLDEKDL
jgi:transketolase